MVDLACAIALFAAAALVAIAYAIRVARFGAARDPRVDRVGGSPLLGKAAMEMGVWALRPLSSAGSGARAFSWASLGLGFGAGCAIGLGHFGLGAAMGLVSSSCAALDGRTAVAKNDSGRMLAAAADRYAELLLFGGIALALRSSVFLLVVTLTAMAGGLMVSYASAKAEALGVQAPRGAMRRPERAVYLVVALALVPIAGAAGPRWGAPAWFARLPLAAALVFVAVAANASAVRRLAAVARAVRPVTSPRSGRRRPGAAPESATNGHVTAGDALH